MGLAAGAQVSIDYAARRGKWLLSLVLAGSLGPGNIETELAEFSKPLAIRPQRSLGVHQQSSMFFEF